MNQHDSICEPLKQIVYISNATAAFSEDALTGLLLQARRNNALNHISGVLLQHGKCFVQCIEGPASAIDRLYARICSDSRHTNIIPLLQHDIASRSFPDWHMGCTLISDSQYLQLANARWEVVSNQLAGSHADGAGFRFLLAFWNDGRSNLS